MNRLILFNIKHTRLTHKSRFISTSLPRFNPRQVHVQPAPQTTTTKIQIEPKIPHSTFQPHIRYIGPTVFGLTLSAGIFVVAGTVFDRNQQTLWDRLKQHSRSWYFLGSANEETVLQELWREKRDLLNEKRLELLESLAQRLNRMSLPLDIKRAVWMVGEKIASMSEAEKTLAGLIAINTVVFACWQIPRLTPFMSKWFLHLPGSRQNITLLTSCFSHQEFFHFALNMVGLWSFGRVIHDNLGREQFLAMYLGIGIGANVVSHVASLASRYSRPLLPSLGASGAIYGLVASTAVLYPNSSISLIFLPMVPITLGFALPVLMGFDLAGILLKWRMFDHFAHLAGAGLGLGYMYYGESHIWAPLIRKIHEARESSENNKRGGNNGRFMWTESRQPEDSSRWSGWFRK